MTGKEYAEIIDSFDVENNSKYLPHNGHTYCNIFAQDVAKECGTPPAYRWLHFHAGSACTQSVPQVVLCNL